jgi:hypothetical protein
MAKKLADRKNAAWVVGGLGLATSVGLIVAGASKWGRHSDPADPSFMKADGGDKLFVGGLATALVATVATIAILPRRNDFLDVVNTWNTRHPDQQFTLEHGMAGR